MKPMSAKQKQKRYEVVQKTAELLEKTSYESLTVRKICRYANIGAGTFYHYFRNKADLVLELFGLVDDYLEEKVIPRMTSQDELENLVTYSRGFAEYVMLCGDERSRLINSLFPIYKVDGPHDERKRPLFYEVRECVVRGQQKGQIGSSYQPDALVDMIVVILRGYCFDWARRHGGYDLVERTDKLMCLFLQGIRK